MYMHIVTLGTGSVVYQFELHLSIDTREIAMPEEHTHVHVLYTIEIHVHVHV